MFAAPVRSRLQPHDAGSQLFRLLVKLSTQPLERKSELFGATLLNGHTPDKIQDQIGRAIREYP